jgi:predicted nucleic-acid-binding protein
MIGLDTNVLARYVTQDDPKQSPKATRLIESLSHDDQGFVSLVVVVELVWVLASCYEAERAAIAQVLETLLRTKAIVVESSDIVWQALRAYRSGTADFPDLLIARAAGKAGCASTLTFDKGAAKQAGMQLID